MDDIGSSSCPGPFHQFIGTLCLEPMLYPFTIDCSGNGFIDVSEFNLIPTIPETVLFRRGHFRNR